MKENTFQTLTFEETDRDCLTSLFLNEGEESISSLFLNEGEESIPSLASLHFCISNRSVIKITTAAHKTATKGVRFVT